MVGEGTIQDNMPGTCILDVKDVSKNEASFTKNDNNGNETGRNNIFTFTPRDVLEADEEVMAREAILQLESGKKPTYDHVAAMLKRYIESRKDFARWHAAGLRNYSEYGEKVSPKEDAEIERRIQVIDSIPTPEVDISNQNRTLLKEKSSEEVEKLVPRGKSKLFPNGFHVDGIDSFYSHDMIKLSGLLYKELSPEEQLAIRKSIVPFLMSSACEADDDETSTFIYYLTDEQYTKASTQDKLEFARVFFDEIWSIDLNSVKFSMINNIDYADSVFGTPLGQRVAAVLLESKLDRDRDIRPWLLYLAEKSDFNKATQLLGKSILPSQLPLILNSVRSLLGQNDLLVEQRNNLERFGKILLGIDPQDEVNFYKSLDELYQEISFENYRPNLSITEQEVNIVEQFIPDTEEHIKVLDLGCGTGRHLQELEKRKKEKGLTNVTYIGLETNAKHAGKARQNVEPETPIYQASWYAMPFADNSVDIIYSLGRNLPHVETEEKFQEVMKEVFRVLKPGGRIIFDMPDPTKGAYIQARERIKKALENLGVYRELIDDYTESYISYIVDGPEKGKVYNRYAPDPEKVVVETNQSIPPNPFNMMTCVDMMHIPIDDSNGSEDVYYLAEKLSASDIDDPAINVQIEEIALRDEQAQQLVEEIGKLKVQIPAKYQPSTYEKTSEYWHALSEGRDDPEFMALSQRIHKMEEEYRRLKYSDFKFQIYKKLLVFHTRKLNTLAGNVRHKLDTTPGEIK